LRGNRFRSQRILARFVLVLVLLTLGAQKDVPLNGWETEARFTLSCLLRAQAAPSLAPFDILIVNGWVVDGTGKPAYKADVGIRNGRIERLGSLGRTAAKQTIDARGLLLAPGFIDAHTHLEEQIKLSTRRFVADNFILQGVTTVITGNCGRSAPDIAALFRKLQRLKLAVNIATLVGHNTIRQLVCGPGPSTPTPAQLHRMESQVEAAIENGAVGFSTGLCYKPGSFASEDEVVALVARTARQGALYATHIRDEGAGGMAGLEEAVRTAQRAKAPKLHISHFKAVGRSQWGTARARLEWVRQAAAPGMRITTDLYPYTSLSSTLDYLIPPEAFRLLPAGIGGKGKDLQSALDATLEKLHRDGWQDYGRVRVCFSERHKEWIGRAIPDIVASVEGVARPSARTQAAWILKNQARGDVQVIAEEMSEQDLRSLVGAPEMAFGSDSSVHYRGLGRPHPRGSGTFPRVFAEYVRNLKLLSVEEAVRRATALPAQIFELPDRGLLREGFWADLVLFSPERIQDRATSEDPWQPPDGIPYVIENGVLVVRNAKVTGALPGQPVRRRAVSAGTDVE
jgi:N-acyl-D-amino-acid deacylase